MRSQAIGEEAKSDDDRLLNVFRQEVDRNYAASVEGVVIPAEWVRSAIDAHIRLGFEEHPRDDCYAGLDVADGGGDRNALAIREGVILRAKVKGAANPDGEPCGSVMGIAPNRSSRSRTTKECSIGGLAFTRPPTSCWWLFALRRNTRVSCFPLKWPSKRHN
jgi:hypothetical protein